MFNEKGTKLLIIIFNQANFKVDSPKPINLKRKMCVIKRKPIRLTLIKYLFQTRTNSIPALVTRTILNRNLNHDYLLVYYLPELQWIK